MIGTGGKIVCDACGKDINENVTVIYSLGSSGFLTFIHLHDGRNECLDNLGAKTLIILLAERSMLDAGFRRHIRRTPTVIPLIPR